MNNLPRTENQDEFLEAIRLGEQQADEGTVISLQQLEENLKTWIAGWECPDAAPDGGAGTAAPP